MAISEFQECLVKGIHYLQYSDQLYRSFMTCLQYGQVTCTIKSSVRNRFQQRHYFEKQFYRFIYPIIQFGLIMKQDLFGYKNQGVNYDTYRPKYPPQMLSNLLSKTKNKNRYLDVATGTGQIFFQLFSEFAHAEGNDLSKNMINVCLQKIKNNNLSKVQFKCQNYMEAKYESRFDLITIGQALHWLPIKDFLLKSKYLLSQEGKLAVFGYILNDVELSNSQDSLKIKGLFNQFYDKKVKKNFDFDRDDLHTHYLDQTKYPFQQIYPKVQRQIVHLTIGMTKVAFISYLKTFSGYNTYLQRFAEMEDPILPLQKGISEEWEIKCKFDYFSIICSN